MLSSSLLLGTLCACDSTGGTPSATSAPTPAPLKFAGENTGLTRDGTPKKYFILNFDDGITQDRRIIEILKKYNATATFNINTGLLGESWDWVADAVKVPGLTHKRFTEEELRSGIYDGMDVDVHTLNHANILECSDETIINEVQKDADNIADLFGYKPRGMAYAGGNFFDDHSVRVILENTDVRFSRTITSSNKFTLPKYWMKWNPTCHVNAGNVKSLAKKFINLKPETDSLFYVWGHGYELDQLNSWDSFEELIKMISEADDITILTSAEFYELFKDEIPCWED